jgi:hypothetical protein
MQQATRDELERLAVRPLFLGLRAPTRIAHMLTDMKTCAVVSPQSAG